MKDTMVKEELKEMFSFMESIGMNPLLCDTPVAQYDVSVRAGVPVMPGDVVEGDFFMFPKSLAGRGATFMVSVAGDSMKDAGVYPGDIIHVCADGCYGDGDIVVAYVDGETTVKAYVRDREGNHWLVPCNPDYDPILLSEDMDVRIIGRVLRVVRDMPRPSLRTLMDTLERAAQKDICPKEVAPEDVIVNVAHMVKYKRQWYAVCRALVDMGLLEKGMYTTFVEMVSACVPEHPCLPDPTTLSRMESGCFSKPVERWEAGNAPVSGARFERYLKIARACFNSK